MKTIVATVRAQGEVVTCSATAGLASLNYTYNIFMYHIHTISHVHIAVPIILVYLYYNKIILCDVRMPCLRETCLVIYYTYKD